MDTSALLKRYVREPESDACERLLLADAEWITARHTAIEVRRNLSRLLEGDALVRALAAFEQDWQRLAVIALDEVTCERATEVAEATGARTPDALHLAAALRIGGRTLSFLTYDLRQAIAARQLGLAVIGT